MNSKNKNKNFFSKHLGLHLKKTKTKTQDILERFFNANQ